MDQNTTSTPRTDSRTDTTSAALQLLNTTSNAASTSTSLASWKGRCVWLARPAACKALCFANKWRMVNLWTESDDDTFCGLRARKIALEVFIYTLKNALDLAVALLWHTSLVRRCAGEPTLGRYSRDTGTWGLIHGTPASPPETPAAGD